MDEKKETAGRSPAVSAAERSIVRKEHCTTQRIFGIDLPALVNHRHGVYHPKGGEKR